MSSQVVGQVLAFATGIIVVRAMDKSVYGHYGIVVSTLAMLTFLSDSGATSVLMSHGATHIADRSRLSGLFAEGLRHRQRFGWPIAAATCAFLFFILRANESSPLQAFLCSATAFVTFAPILIVGTTQPALRLFARIGVLELTTVGVAATRLALSLILLASGATSVEAFLLVNLGCSALTAVIYFRTSRSHLDPHERDPRARKLFWPATTRVFPMIFMIITGEQIYLALIAHNATPEIVGEALALSRFAVAFVVVNAAISDIAAPWLARAPRRSSVVIRRLAAIIFLYVGVSALIVALIAYSSPYLIDILGSQYEGLERPMVGFAASYALFYVGLSWDSINQARGWVSLSWCYIPLLGAWLACSYLLIDYSSLWGIVALFGGLAIPMILTQAARTAYGLRTMREMD